MDSKLRKSYRNDDHVKTQKHCPKTVSDFIYNEGLFSRTCLETVDSEDPVCCIGLHWCTRGPRSRLTIGNSSQDPL